MVGQVNAYDDTHIWARANQRKRVAIAFDESSHPLCAQILTWSLANGSSASRMGIEAVAVFCGSQTAIASSADIEYVAEQKIELPPATTLASLESTSSQFQLAIALGSDAMTSISAALSMNAFKLGVEATTIQELVDECKKIAEIEIPSLFM